MPVKPACPYPTRRSIIAAASGLAAAAACGKFSRAQLGGSGLPDAMDALTQMMPQAAPALFFHDARGRRLSLADYSGHGLLVNFWATWCGPCVAEIPSLNQLAPKVRERGVLVLPVSIDTGGAATVRAFYASHAIRALPILLDPDADDLQALNTDGIPVTIILNAAGQLVARVDGAANWNTPRTVQFLRSLGSAKPGAGAPKFTPV